MTGYHSVTVAWADQYNCLNRFFQKQIWSHRCPVWTLLCVETPVHLHRPLLRSLNSLNDRRTELSPYLCHVLPSAGLFSLVQTTPFPDNFQLLFVIWLLPSQSVGCCHRLSKSLGCSLSPDVNSSRQDWGLIYLSNCSICIMFGIFVGIQKWIPGWMNEE